MEESATRDGPGARLDKKDLRLLHLLDLNAREPLASLAKKVRLSKEGVAYRIRRLEEAGVLRGFGAVIDFSALGYVGGGYMIRLQHCDQAKEDEIVDYFKHMKKTWWVDSRGGDYDLGVAIYARSHHELYDFKLEFMRRYRPHIMKVAPRIYHRMHQYPRTYLSGAAERENARPLVLWNGAEKEHDATDEAILRLVSTRARLPMVEMARCLGLTPAVVKYRLKKMEQAGIILGYRAGLDLKRLGYFWYKVDIYIRDFAKRESIMRYCASLPNVVYMYDAIGDADIEIEVEVKGADQLLSLINSIRSKFSDDIISYDYYLWSYEHKLALVTP
ncbi:putative HTH-type transcriptional regulator [uncultured archaeon]|nr:putative HTH-type transcriptional regulator [uncultured archaeon]